MYRSYRVIFQGKAGQYFVMARSACEASELAAKAVQDGYAVRIEDPDERLVSVDELAEIIRTGQQ
jgi:hypothetical protein